MTVITVRGMQSALGAAEPLTTGWVIAEYWSGGGPFIGVDGTDVEFPRELRIQIVDGALAESLDLVETGGRCCVRLRVEDTVRRRSLTRFVSIPASGPIDFEDLVDVDPDAFLPVDQPASILSTVRDELLDGLTIERVTQEEYDAIPTPRPGDVLYVVVITP